MSSTSVIDERRYWQTLKHYRRKIKRKADEWNREFHLQPHLEKFVHGKPEVAILDVGSGPFPTVGTLHDHMKISLRACDILAKQWEELFEEAGISPVHPVEYADMEEMPYASGTFDLVHCRNALDHTEDPMKAISEFLRVCKSGGVIFLEHFENEGRQQSYLGQHFWNIQQLGGGNLCRIWNEEQEFFLTDVLGDISVWSMVDWDRWVTGRAIVYAVIKKK